MRRAYDRRAELSRTQAEPARYFEYAERAFALTPNPTARDRATEIELQRAALEHAAVVHIATHGLIDEEEPPRSGLALTLAQGSDGILQMREIYGLQLQAGLVTLSACQTALGKGVTGEGIVGLTRAFLHAGAGAVLASLWNVNDVSTADFMARFDDAPVRTPSGSSTTARPSARVPHHGVPFGGAAFGPGVVGDALTLDGVSGRVDIPDSSGLTVNGEMTLAAWIKPNQLGAPFIVSKYDSSVQQVSWTFQINGSELRFTVYGEPTGFIEGRAVSSVGADIVPGTFTHVAVTFRRGG